MADTITGNTQLVATKEALIAATVQRELRFQSKLLPLITDVSVFAQPGMKSISFPKLGSFTAVNRASGAAGDATTLLSSVDTLNLDQNAYIAWLIDSMDITQSKIASKLEFARRAASGHARYVDDRILATANAVYSNTSAGGAITRDDVLAGREYLLKKNADMSNLVVVCAVNQETNLLKIDEFTRADMYGSSNIPNGMIGRLYNMPVVVSNGLADDDFFIWDKAGMVIGFQQAPNYSAQPANEYGSTAMREVIDQLFGTAGQQIAEQGAAAGKSPLVWKL